MSRKPRVLMVKYHENANFQPLSPRANRILGVFPPLGIAYIAAYLRQKGYDVSMLDVQAENLDSRETATRVAALEPDIVGLTAKTMGWSAVLETATAIKAGAPRSLLVLGGPHATIFPEESLSFDCFDIAAMGDGEETMAEVCERFVHGGGYDGIEGTAVRRKDGSVARHGQAREVKDLDSLPPPAVDLLPMNRYDCLTVLRPFYTMITSRGCPYKCGFCSQIYCGDRIRVRNSRLVADEMEDYVRRRGARELVLFDETFTVGKQRILRLCEEVRARGLKFRWNVRTRVDAVDRDVLAALHAAGCRSLHMGVESGNSRILEKMQKGTTLEQVREAFALASEFGFETRGYFMLGYLDEDEGTMRDTVELSRSLGLDWASFSITVPYPATPLYAEASSRGYIAPDFWRRYTLEGGTLPIPHLETEAFNFADLQRIRRAAYMRFYLRPRTVLKKALSLRSLHDIADMARGAVVLGNLTSRAKPG